MSESKQVSRARIRALHSQGFNDNQIALELQVSRSLIKAHRNQMGLARNRVTHENPVSVAKSTARHTEFLNLYSAGLTDREIGRRLGITRTSAARRRAKLGLPINPAYKSIDVVELKKLHAEDLTDSEIAFRLKTKTLTVSKYRQKLGLTKNHANARAVRQLHSEGLSNWSIGHQLGIRAKSVEVVLRKLSLKSNNRIKSEQNHEQSEKRECSKCKEFKHLAPRSKVCINCQYEITAKRINANLQKTLQYRNTWKRNVAKRNNVEYHLTAADWQRMWNDQNGKCFYCDVPLQTELGAGRSADSISVDRLDCDGDYSADNTVLCCFSCNRNKRRKPAIQYQTDCCARMISDAMTAGGWQAEAAKSFG